MTTTIYTHTKSLEKRKNTWLNKAKLKHNSKYKYPFMEDYINAHSVMRIICPIHGEFKITAFKHTSDGGCGWCGTAKKTTEQWIEEAISVHGYKFDYSLVDYNGINNEVTIICPIHGVFKTTPKLHLGNIGCLSCSRGRSGWKTKKNSPNANDYCVVYEIKLTGNGEEFYKIGISNRCSSRHRKITNESGYQIEIINIIQDTRYNCEVLAEKVQKNRQRRGNYRPLIKFGGWTECYTI